MQTRADFTAGGVPVKVFTDDVDGASIQQLSQVSRLPIVVGHVAAMPDVHAGIGATIGSVIATGSALIPAAVGVDIGCGMTAVQLSLQADELPDNLRPLRDAIENAVPLGKSGHTQAKAPDKVIAGLRPRVAKTLERHPAIRKMIRSADEKWVLQLGSLGGGNHFIEVVIDESESVWIMLHSGSRGIGNAVGRYFTRLAKDEMRRLDRRMPENKELSWVEEGTPAFTDYCDALEWAQRYALENRRVILNETIWAIRPLLPRFHLVDDVVECHHNYVAEEPHFGRRVFVTRKGAIRARAGDRGIVPGSMGARSYIVRGLGAAEALESSAHGAGRRMSRSKARAAFTTDDLERQTAGVECRKDSGVLDEIPGAYKDIEAVMANSASLVEIEHTLRQLVCVKG